MSSPVVLTIDTIVTRRSERLDRDRSMQQDESLTRIGALLVDRSRSAMLVRLMDGRAYTATELARAAGIAAPTASHHLEKFLTAGFLNVLQQGRHRYFRIADADVAAFIETALSM